MPMVIRDETDADHQLIREINEAAFGGSEEADLIEALRAEDAVLLSVVAQFGRRIIGHILFSRMWIETPTRTIDAVALAPVAVTPEFQRQGIGGKLIEHGLGVLRRRQERIVIVVGHPAYYPRFGFSAQQARTLENPFPPDVFMSLELVPGALNGVYGRVRYAKAFGL